MMFWTPIQHRNIEQLPMKQLPINSVSFTIPSLRSDRFILLGLALFGLLGSMYLIQKCKINHESAYIHNDQGTLYSNLLSTPIGGIKDQAILQLDGLLEEKAPIQFELNSALSSKKYLVDFGNGDQRIFNKRNFVYAYEEAGNYKLQLMEMKDQRLRMIESRHVLICKNNLYR